MLSPTFRDFMLQITYLILKLSSFKAPFQFKTLAQMSRFCVLILFKCNIFKASVLKL